MTQISFDPLDGAALRAASWCAVTAPHTPGPWKADLIRRGTINIRTGESSEMVPDGYAITAEQPKMFGGTRIVERGLKEADARLIAAAPDLLVALRDLMPILGDCDCIYSDRDKPLCPCRAARAAIAKATGGAL